MATKYFWKKAKGLNADLERHRAEELKLTTKIAELEAGEQTEWTDGYLRTYRNFLYQLELSKVEIVTLIGKKK